MPYLPLVGKKSSIRVRVFPSRVGEPKTLFSWLLRLLKATLAAVALRC